MADVNDTLADLLRRLDRAIGARLDGDDAPQAAAAEAVARATAGLRVTLALDGARLLAAADALATAVDRQVPLVVRVDGAAGHDAAWLLGERGCAVLHATGAAHALDLTLVARRLAEHALLPVLCVTDDGGVTAGAALPAPAAVRRAIGAEADEIAAPTAAQRLLFGERRRRVPRWFDLDRPVQIGARLDPHAAAMTRAARAAYRFDTVADAVEAAFHEVGLALGRDPGGPCVGHRAEDARVTIVAQGAAFAVAVAAADALRGERCKAGVIGVVAGRPLPVRGILDRVRGRQAVVVLERADSPLAAEPPLTRELAAGLQRVRGENGWRDKHVPALHGAAFGLGGELPSPADLAAFVREVERGGRPRVWLGVDFAPDHTAFPKRQALLDRLRRDVPGLADLGCVAPRGKVEPADVAARRPARLLLPLARTSEAHDSLPRFWDQVGVLRASGTWSELTPDPYLAAGTVPPLAAGLAAPGAAAAEIPVLDPAACTGCGACWTACPDGAIGATAVAPRALIEFGIERAKRAGSGAEPLRMLVAKLAGRLGAAPAAGAALRSAFLEVTAKTPLPDARKQAIEDALEATAAALDALPAARTEVLFDRPEQQAKGSGELLALAVDPDACKACGLCVAVCEPGAWRQAPRDPDVAAAARAGWQAWQELPDTRGESIARLAELPEPGLAAALSLSRHALLPFASGDDAEPGSGPRLALRLVLGAVEAHRQPRVRQRLDEIAELQDEFAQKIRETLARALPGDDLEELAEGLHALGRRDFALADLAQRVAAAGTGSPVDGAALDRLVGTARALADLRFRIEHGAQGLGRARAGLLLVGGPATAWATAFPNNPFAQPVVCADSGADVAGLARGLLEGHAAFAVDDARLLRRARHTLDRPGHAEYAEAAANASWAELDDGERGACAPLVVAGGTRELARAGIAELLRTGLPVVVVALADGTAGEPEIGLHAVAERSAFVAQCSIAFRDHLAGATRAALRRGGPALLHVLAPRPSALGIAPAEVLAVAERAVRGRAFPLFRHDPAAADALALRLDLAGNPAGDDEPADAGRAEVWRLLRELAGVETPFTDRLRGELGGELAAAHRAELDAARTRADAELRASRQQVEDELADRLRARLVALALRGGGG